MTSRSASSSAELKNLGLKVTGPRTRILEIFQRNAVLGVRHMSAEDVYKTLLAENLDAGLATVYRVLTQFEQAGLLVRTRLEAGRATYELDEGHHHDHLVCLTCGRVEEFVDAEIERRQREIAAAHGFELLEHSLSLYGECNKPDCPHRPREQATWSGPG
jgi:Fur family transcriptional regulator, ferric uptake regulator